MKRKQKIRVVSIAISIIILLLIILVGVIICGTNDDEDPLNSVEHDIKLVTELYPTRFVIYGSEIDFSSSISVEYIDEICDDNLVMGKDYEYTMIIINDLDNNVNLSDDDWKLVYGYVENDDRYNLMYLGDSDFEQIGRLGILSDMTAFAEGDLSVGIVHEAGQLIFVFGTYVTGASYSLSEALIREQAYSIEQSN